MKDINENHAGDFVELKQDGAVDVDDASPAGRGDGVTCPSLVHLDHGEKRRPRCIAGARRVVVLGDHAQRRQQDEHCSHWSCSPTPPAHHSLPAFTNALRIFKLLGRDV